MQSNLQVQLIDAIQENDIKTVKSILLLGVDLTQTIDYAPLAIAGTDAKKEIFFLLLSHGAELFVDSHGDPRTMTPLRWLVICQRKDIFKILFRTGYLDAHKHHDYLEIALFGHNRDIRKTMLKYFINHGYQGYNFVPAYSSSEYNYEDEPMSCEDVSVFFPYIEKKKKPIVLSRPSRIQTRSFGSSNLLK